MQIKSGVKSINPFLLVAWVLIAVVVLYNLKLSNMYPTLSSNMYIFLIIFITLLFIYGGIYKIIIKKKDITNVELNIKNIKRLLLILSICYLIDFLYSKQVPLLNVFLNSDTNYKEFGIPTFHVILVTFNIFLSNLLFMNILNKSNYKKDIVLYLVSLLPFILIMSRGLIIITIAISLIILIPLIRFSIKRLFLSVITLFLFSIGFGLFGNLRLNADYNYNGNIFDSKIILMVGEATSDFWNLGILNSIFWIYIYITSPLANLQNTINNVVPVYSFGEYSITQLLPDFVSNRLSTLYNVNVELVNIGLIKQEFTAGTQFMGSYIFMGWFGIFFTAILITTIILVVLIFMQRKNPLLFLMTNAIVCSILVFGLFTNMWVYSGLILPLIYCLIFACFFRGLLFKRVVEKSSFKEAGK